MISTTNFSQFRTSEHIQFFNDVSDLCDKNDPEGLKINNQLNKLKSSIDELDLAFKKDMKSVITAQLVKSDQARDNQIICLGKLADGYSYHYNKDFQDAGETILNCIKKYGNRIYALNYMAETSTLDNLGKDLQNDSRLATAVATLNLTNLVAEMVKTNNEFKEIYQSRVQEKAADETVSAGEIIKEAINNYRELTKHITAHATITPSDAYTILIKELNALIEQYNTTVAKRSSVKEEENEIETVE